MKPGDITREDVGDWQRVPQPLHCFARVEGEA